MDEHERKYSMDIISGMAERVIKRQWITIIILILLLFGSNAAWVWYESQFVDEIITQDVDTGEGNAYVTGIGDLNYGEGSSDGENTSTENGR